MVHYRPDGFWFDGLWDRPTDDWDISAVYDLMLSVDPSVLIGNNHHFYPFPREHFQIFEADLPGQNKTGFRRDLRISALPIEMCFSIAGTWGISRSAIMTPREILLRILNAVAVGSNVLVNIAPSPDGSIPQDQQHALRLVGNWIKKRSSAVYETSAGPLRDDGVLSTFRAGGRGSLRDELFIFYTKAAGGKISFPLRNYTAVSSFEYFPSGISVEFSVKNNVVEALVEPEDALITSLRVVLAKLRVSIGTTCRQLNLFDKVHAAQSAAVESWVRLGWDVVVVSSDAEPQGGEPVGDGVSYESVASHGKYSVTPLFRDIVNRTASRASDVVIFANCDMIVDEDFNRALLAAKAAVGSFALTTRRCNIEDIFGSLALHLPRGPRRYLFQDEYHVVSEVEESTAMDIVAMTRDVAVDLISNR
jgi:hypothetical protein